MKQLELRLDSLERTDLIRRIGRVVDELSQLGMELEDLKAAVARQPDRDEFDELVANVLRRVQVERSEEKRRALRWILIGALQGDEYDFDERLRFMRDIDHLHPDHIKLMRAMWHERATRDEPNTMVMALAAVTGVPWARVQERMEDLKAWRITTPDFESLRTTASPKAIQAKKSLLTSYGKRLTRFVLSPDDLGQP